MGMLFKRTEEFFNPKFIPDDQVFVEIGSERGEGSTGYYAQLAKKYHTKLYTVDVNPQAQAIAKSIHKDIDNVYFEIGTGSLWAKNIWPTYNKKIACLYLDNFDYNWDVSQKHTSAEMIEIIKQQQKDYLARGIVMNNLNCQVEHMVQMEELLPSMADTSIVVCDDTVTYNECYIGKCGAVVPYLIAHGYKILTEQDHGVILGKNLN